MSNEPEAYLKPSQTSTRKHFCKKKVNGYKPLTIFAKKLLQMLDLDLNTLCEYNLSFNIFYKNIAYGKLVKFFKVLPEKNKILSVSIKDKSSNSPEGMQLY